MSPALTVTKLDAIRPGSIDIGQSTLPTVNIPAQISEDMMWPGSLAEARLVQQRLRAKVIIEDRLGPVRIVAGVDAWTEPGGKRIWAAAVALGLPDLELRESAIVCQPITVPYIPGFLSFREAPAALAALKRLRLRHDLLFVDGQGLAHPRRFGLACHIGLLAATPTIGVAKSRLLGRYEPPGPDRGDWTPLVDNSDVVGAVLRTRSHTRPVFVSVGHRISLRTAIDYVLRCTPAFRLPEPIRLADRLSRAFR
jgi:deoxyribonuclease V